MNVPKEGFLSHDDVAALNEPNEPESLTWRPQVDSPLIEQPGPRQAPPDRVERMEPRRQSSAPYEPPPQPAARKPRAPPPPQPEPVVEPPPAEDEGETWPVVVKLLHRKGQNNKGEEIDKLEFREPTGGDINRCGMPVRVDQTGDVIIVPQAMTLMIAALSGLLSPKIEALDPRDWSSCAYRLRGFFLPDPSAW
jgi:hypothetical protein